jgi:hypothetical protein
MVIAGWAAAGWMKAESIASATNASASGYTTMLFGVFIKSDVPQPACQVYKQRSNGIVNTEANPLIPCRFLRKNDNKWLITFQGNSCADGAKTFLPS